MLLVISLVPVLFGLGLVIVALYPRVLEEARETIEGRWQLVALVFASGIMLDYLIVVIVEQLFTAFVIVAAIAVLSSVFVVARHARAMADCSRLGIGPALLFAVGLSLLSLPILLEPLIQWDARSIWFFHAKNIYFSGGLFKDSWSLPSIAFAHVDYPKLVPVLAAQISMLAQFWNEQLPKFSLLILLAPPLALTFSYWRAWLSFAAISVLVWLRLDPDLCGGYMDAPLAMFGLFAALQLGAWLTRGSQLNLVGGIVFIAIACGLKNEGSLLGLSAVFCTAAVFVFIRSRGRELLPNRRSERVRLGLVCLLVALSCVAWPIVRAHWGMHNDLQLGLQSIPRMIQRLHEPKMLAMIAQSTWLDSGLAKAALIGVAMIAISVCFRQKRLIEPILCVAVATIYLAGIEFVYLSTPVDLEVHLKTSADRTTLLPIVLFLAPVFLLFRDLTLTRTELARGPVASG